MKETAADPSRLIALLNSLQWGDLDAIHARLREAHACCLELKQDDLAAKLDEASAALRGADVKTYRKNVETVVSRLGHLR
jgi:hypothetical protein